MNGPAAGDGPLTGGDLLVASLIANGLDTIFTLPGLQLDPAFDALAKRPHDVRVLHTRHEQGAAYMADGFARVTGRPSMCMVVPGPGLLNAMAGLATAYACSSPVLCVTGQTPSGTIDAGLGLLHEIKNQLEMVRAVVKWSGRAMHPEDIPDLLFLAVTEMLTGRPLPAEVEIPPDVLAAVTPTAPEIRVAEGRRAVPDTDALARAGELLLGAQRPLIMAGGGVIRSGAGEQVTALAERLGAPVIMTTNGKGSLSARHALAFEATAIPHLLPAADVVVAVGTRFAPRNGTRWPLRGHQTLIKVDAEAAELTRGIAPHVSIEGDARAVTELLVDLLPAGSKGGPAWRELDGLRLRLRNEADAILPQAQYGRVIRDTLSDDTIVIDGMNQVGYWSRFGYPVYTPRTFISPGYQGTLGFELPTGLGAQVGAPDQRVVILAGDGGFMFNVGELATAVQHKINAITIVFNDNAYGNVLRTQDDDYGGRRIASDLVNPDFMKLADSFGVPGMRAEGPDDLGRCLRIALDDDRPTIIEVPVKKMHDPWPLIQGH
ncbi:MAG: thiamine pyrophosphate-dependent enzyme [Candidatus Dormibacteria bacterium]